MKEMAQQAGSPVRSSYSNNSSLADIAARVVEEFRAENENDDEFLYVGDLDAELSLISTADQIFYNGQIRPVFPIFNPNYWESATGTSSMCNSSLSSSGDEQQQQKVSTPPQTMIRLPLRKLLLSEDQETPSSCSSSEADELEGIPEGMYCVWRPKEVKDEASASASPGKCKKSNSTGWRWRSKRWRLPDLVHRSNSHGKDTFVFLTKGEDKAGAKSNPNLTHYTKNRSGDKRRHSYLPYRQHLVGFFANVKRI
nr:Candidapepsin-7 like [Ipomoea batatas]